MTSTGSYDGEVDDDLALWRTRPVVAHAVVLTYEEIAHRYPNCRGVIPPEEGE